MEPTSENKPHEPTVEELQLRKAQLEVASLERAEKFDIETEEEKRRKLFYEKESLRWQTTLIYRASQFATIFTIFATLFGVYEAYDKLISDKRNEVEQRRKESTERTTGQFLADLRNLLQYPIDKNQTISQGVFELRDLTHVVEDGFKGDDKEQVEKRKQVGSLITQLIRSPEFDLSQTRNTDFDRKAMVKENSEYYSQYLIDNPQENRDILSKYKSVLSDIHDQDPGYYETFQVDPQDQTAFIESKVSKDQTKFFQYAYLFQAYQMHVDLLGRSSDPHVRDYLDLAYCWFWGATRNVSLIKAIFSDTDDQLAKKNSVCDSRERQPPRIIAGLTPGPTRSAKRTGRIAGTHISHAETGGDGGGVKARRKSTAVRHRKSRSG